MMTKYEVGTRVFDTWIIQQCITQENEYSHFIIQAGHDDQTTASLWVVNFPATHEDFMILQENGMTEDEAITFFRQAADDYVGSLLMSEDNGDNHLLLTIDDCIVEYDDLLHTSTILLKTERVEALAHYIECHTINEESALHIAYKLCDAVDFVNNNQLPRRLLTIDNIFINSNGDFLLGCFGSISDNRFQSPEEHRGEETLYNSDVNSIGVILYTILNNGRIPLLPKNIQNPTKDDIAVAVQDRHAGMPFPPPANAGSALTTVILKACAFKSKSRYASVAELKNALYNLRTGNTDSLSTENDVKKKKRTNIKDVKKFVFSSLTVLVIIVTSWLLIDILTESAPSELDNFPPKETTTHKGMTVIIHTEPDVVTQVPTTEQIAGSTENQLTQEKIYPDSFFSEIATYHSGNYYMKGILEQDGEPKQTELAITRDKTIYMLSDVDGMAVGIMRDKDLKIYLVNPTAMSCLELSPAVLKFLGMDTSSLDKASEAALSHSGFEYPHNVTRVQYKEQDFVRASYTFENGKMEVFYIDESGHIKYIESYSDVNTLSNIMTVQSLTSDVPDEYKGVSGLYTIYRGMTGMFSFIGTLATE